MLQSMASLFELVEIFFKFECFVSLDIEKIFLFFSLGGVHHHDTSAKIAVYDMHCEWCESNDGPFL